MFAQTKGSKNFGPPFLKGGAVEAAQASSPSAEGETPKAAFLFVNFFFAPPISKEKVAMEAEDVRATIAFFPRIAKRT